jgi:histidinol phosphatase-like enzyme
LRLKGPIQALENTFLGILTLNNQQVIVARPQRKQRTKKKPRIGLLKKSARDLKLDLKKCVFVGDHLKDIQAGNRAGCRTLLVQTGQGEESLIKIISCKTRIKSDCICDDLPSAAPLVLEYFLKINLKGITKTGGNMFSHTG